MLIVTRATATVYQLSSAFGWRSLSNKGVDVIVSHPVVVVVVVVVIAVRQVFIQMPSYRKLLAGSLSDLAQW